MLSEKIYDGISAVSLQTTLNIFENDDSTFAVTIKNFFKTFSKMMPNLALLSANIMRDFLNSL